jgi:hypothetical protein
MMFEKRGVKFLNPADIRMDVSPIDDQTLACIANLPHLRRLDLSWANVGDAGMEHVCRLHKLQELVLQGTDVSDASAGILTDLRNLKRLHLYATAATKVGVSELQAALPDCDVTDRFEP